MFGYFDYEKLNEIASNSSYQYAEPFPHIVIDNVANEQMLDEVLSVYPKPEDVQWWKYNNVFEKKLAFDRVELLPLQLKLILSEMNSKQFVQFLERLTGVSGLIVDTNFAGGGLHQILPGGKLGIHADFNWLKHQQLHRRLNVLLYLNKDWKEEYGGHLEVWDNEVKKCYNRILPIFNRMVIFNTTDFSQHGHPDPLTCPEGMSRKSLALYYYSATRPANEISESHSTVYKPRPNDEDSPELQELRKKRAKGRLEDATT